MGSTLPWLLRAFAPALGLMLSLTASAAAQDPPRAAVLPPSVEGDASAGFGQAFTRLLRDELQSLGVVELVPSQDVALSDMQLAMGCVAESRECLGPLAEGLGVEAIVYGSIQLLADSDAVVISLSFFDARASGSPQQATRRVFGEARALDEVPTVARELFGLPAPVSAVPQRREEPAQPDGGTGSMELTPAGSADLDASPGLSPLPFVVGGAGLLSVGAGVLLGLAASDSEQEYAEAPKGNPTEVDAALDIKSQADTQALWANVAFIAGGGLVALSAVLFVVLAPGDDEEQREERPLVLRPSLGPSTVGLTLGGPLGRRW